MSSLSSQLTAGRLPPPCSQHLSNVDWSQLPRDLIVSIANKLSTFEDFLSFSVVCHSWRFIILHKNWTPSHSIPWLVVNWNLNSKVPIRHFFNIYNNKAYKLPLPEAIGRRCWGSSHGWVLTVDRDLKFTLLNPITRVCFNLPPHFPLNNHEKNYWFSYICNVTIFKIRDKLVTMVIYGKYRSLAFAKPGDSAWTTMQISTHLHFSNVVYFEDQILAVSDVGMLLLVEIDGLDPPRAVHIASPPQDEIDWTQIHLVESSGDLLMVLQYAFPNKVLKFKVYKFDFNAKMWRRIESLGDCALFVDDSYCVSVSTRSDFQSNCIYFVKDVLGGWWALKERHYCGVYDMKDETVQTFLLNVPNLDESFLHYDRPMWLIPTL